ncbi:TetR/AcrR family transcriptional regulator [Mycobacterium sp. IS-3022]|uniref:TetR/AcrR family transcriptional regulator n=1 Tax=Mycobacterium sp. IS-3022 TaxID=1772277 RepID=UPI0007415ED7|nr:TetR/AcrR family transcriptional regulator [Mycobacterium sp. IS-3022]KUI02840.1 TetR family transcriptional regulator [Mycobacterium sp. IS-3022]
MAQVRPYRGVEAAERLADRRRRLLEAGLDLLGTGDPAELTVRAICAQAGLGVRYFYESFSDKDDLIGQVYDWVIGRIATTTQAAVAAAPAGEKNRAAMANIVQSIAADNRVGRLVFSSRLSNGVVLRKRAESFALMVMLTFQTASEMGAQRDSQTKAAAHFVVGGVTQTITAWLDGDIELDDAQLVDHLAALLDHLAVPPRSET